MMISRNKMLLLVGVVCFAAHVSAQDVGSETHPVAQAAADAIRDAARADGAFIAAGLLKDGALSGDLASIFQYPTDKIVVVRLTGAEVRQALERSVSTYPSSNRSFLQLSGFVVTFSSSKPAESRIFDVVVDGKKLDPNGTYEVAMPESLARGALGYFRIWNSARIVRSLDSTIEATLKGKTGEVRESRYIVKP
ncbi:MAG: hypothetical protein C4341_09135 [Armatimonadota bacterium]